MQKEERNEFCDELDNMIESLQAQLLRTWRVANIELYDVTLDLLERVIDVKKKLCK